MGNNSPMTIEFWPSSHPVLPVTPFFQSPHSSSHPVLPVTPFFQSPRSSSHPVLPVTPFFQSPRSVSLFDLPAGQGVQETAPLSEYEPLLQVTSDEGVLHSEPAGQVVHPAAWALEKKPAWHDSSLAAPARQNFPDEQSEQAVSGDAKGENSEWVVGGFIPSHPPLPSSWRD